jgi:hypothetical protein
MGYLERISEIYRRCFEPENDDRSKAGLGRGKLSVLRDFAAHFPHLISKVPWVCNLMAFRAADPDVLRALANGFRRAASLASLRFRQGRLEAARIALSKDVGTVDWELRQIVESIDLPVLKIARSREMAQRKLRPAVAESARASRAQLDEAVRNMIEKYPSLAPDKKNLTRLLEHGNVYEAKILIISKLFQVSPRTLQRKK